MLTLKNIIIKSILIFTFLKATVLANECQKIQKFLASKKYDSDTVTNCVEDDNGLATSFTINNFNLTKTDANTLVSQYKGIKKLEYYIYNSSKKPNLGYMGIPPKVSRMENLANLKVSYYFGYHNKDYFNYIGYANFTAFPKFLKTLTLENIMILQNDVERISNVKYLKKLAFYGCKINPDENDAVDGLASLNKLSNINELTFNSSDNNNELPKNYIFENTNLKHLTIENYKLNTDTLSEIENLTGLSSITLKNIQYDVNVNNYTFTSMSKLKDVYIELNYSSKYEKFNQEINLKLPSSVKSLYLSGIDLTSTNIKDISSNSKKIEKITIDNMQKVKELDLSTFKNIRKLRELNIRNVEDALILNLNKIQSLKKLTMENFIFSKDVRDQISKISGLEELSIYPLRKSSKNSVFNLVPLNKLSNLSILEIQGEYTEISNILNSFHNLTRIVITENEQFTEFVDCDTLRDLEYIDFHSTKISKVPSSIDNLLNLKYLDISSCEVSALPSTFCRLNNLEYLNISYNPYDLIDIELGFLRSLKTLIMNGCGIYELIEELGYLKNLTMLSAEANKLPNVDVVTEMVNLKELYLSHNKIETIPNDIGKLKDLEILDVSYNRIKVMPKSLSDLSELKKFSIHSNRNIDGYLLPNKKLEVCYYCYPNKPSCTSMDCYKGEETDFLDLPISTDGRCGKGYARCEHNYCCNKYGYCDVTEQSCQLGYGCQPKYGFCKPECPTCEPSYDRNDDIELNLDTPNYSQDGKCGKLKDIKDYNISHICPEGSCCMSESYCLSNSEDCKVEHGCISEFGDACH